MTPKEEYDLATHWYDRVRIMSLYHYYCCVSNNNWHIIDTAHYFDISKSLVAENLCIAKKLDELKDIGSRNKALRKLRGIKIND